MIRKSQVTRYCRLLCYDSWLLNNRVQQLHKSNFMYIFFSSKYHRTIWSNRMYRKWNHGYRGATYREGSYKSYVDFQLNCLEGCGHPNFCIGKLYYLKNKELLFSNWKKKKKNCLSCTLTLPDISVASDTPEHLLFFLEHLLISVTLCFP